MTIEFMDNFSLYGVGGEGRMANGLYANIGDGASIVNDPDPTASGQVYRAAGGGTGERGYRRVLGGNRARVGAAARVWNSQLPTSGSNMIFSFRDVGNGTLCQLNLLPNGSLQFTSGSPTITTAGPVIVASGWQHVEVLVDFSTTVGEVEVRVEGVTVLTGTNLNTGVSCAQVSGCATSNTAFWQQFHKDLIIYNGLGAANNDFIGACIVASLNPASDVALNWTPSTGANGFSILDNRPPNDSEFIQAGDPPPAAYEATLTNLPPDVTSVRALQTVVRAAKVDGGDGNLQISMVSGVSVSNGANRPITSAFTYWTDIFEVDPATGASWAPAAVDAAQMRMNRTV